MWAEIDEFRAYPGDFRLLLDLAESERIDYFLGYLVDRVAESCERKPFDRIA